MMSMVILVTGYSSELDIYYNYVGGVGRAGPGRVGPARARAASVDTPQFRLLGRLYSLI